MFKPTTFKPGLPIRTKEFDWYAPTTNCRKRLQIPGQEILDAFKSDQKSYGSFSDAKSAADSVAHKLEPLEQKATRCFFMELECPIFEMNGTEMVFVHFQGNTFTPQTLENLNKPQTSSCLIA